MIQLSDHFTLKEFEASEVAARLSIVNTMPPVWWPSAIKLCQEVLEPVRTQFGPIRINSGYRCKELNTKIGGAWGSQHQFGQAADIIPLAKGVTPRDLLKWIVKNVPFDQAIDEFGGAWCHVSYAPILRGEVLAATALPGRKRATYIKLTSSEIDALGL